MFQKKHVFIFLTILIFVKGVWAQEEALSKIDVADLKEYLSFISADSLQGRKLGTEINGLDISARYIAENIKELGLKRGTENYFQKVNMVSLQALDDGYIKIQNKRGKRIFETSEIIELSSFEKVVEYFDRDVLFCGFGDGEYASESMEGKIVVIAQGNSESYKKGDDFRWNNRLEGKKIESISKANPAAIILVTNPNDSFFKTFNRINRWYNRARYSLKDTSNTSSSVSTIIVKPKLADKILGGKNKYKQYLNSISDGEKNKTQAINGISIGLKSGKISKSVEAKNIVGFVEGADPNLKDECVVFMAHYDHLGLDGEGNVYNGADDNGSGTVTLMELAEAFSSLKTKPKRSIVFLWVCGEEIGLIGSKYYTQNPVFPLEKTKACINIDMDGRVYEPRDSVWKHSPKMVKDFDGLFTLTNDVWPGLKEICNMKCNELGLLPDDSLPAGFLRSSDHYNFHKNGVPIANFATGYHADYHKVSDEIDKISFDKIKRVSDLCFLVGYEIANRKEIETK